MLSPNRSECDVTIGKEQAGLIIVPYPIVLHGPALRLHVPLCTFVTCTLDLPTHR